MSPPDETGDESLIPDVPEPGPEEERLTFRDAFGSLPLFDDVYLRMQAMNLDIVDGFLENEEALLLRQYIETERTPRETLFVSAFSQLWVFGMYELLRTWRGRVSDVLRFAQEWHAKPRERRKGFLQERRRKVRALTQYALGSPWRHYSRALRSASFLREVEIALDRSELAFRRIEALRVSLAKHQIPKSKGAAALAPGYGRIDGSTGSIQWQIILEGYEVDLVSRRTIADECRAFSSISPALFLPRQIQTRMGDFPRDSYGTKRVKVTLRGGRTMDGVIVAWNKQIVDVEGDEPPFDARKIIDVESSPPRIHLPRKRRISRTS